MKRNESSYSFLLFTVKAEYFALPIDQLVEVTEPLHVSALPFVPDYIDGLINLNSQIIPQIDASQLLAADLKQEGNAAKQQTLIVFKSSEPHYALRVGLILDSITLEADQLDFIDQDQDTDDSDELPSFIAAKFTYTQNNQAHLVKVFDAELAESLIGSQSNENNSDTEQGFLGELSDTQKEDESTTEYILFSIGSQEYAIKLTDILEVIDLDNIQATQHLAEKSDDLSFSLIQGIGLVRGIPVFVLNIRQWLDIVFDKDHCSNNKNSSATSVIILANDEYYCAIEIDHISGMIEAKENQHLFDEDSGQHMLKLYNDTQAEQTESSNSEEEQILDQAQLIQILDTQALYNSNAFDAVKSLLPKLHETDLAPVKTHEVLQFHLHQTTYGILIDDIERVINNQRIEPMITDKAFLLGSCEFDGHVIPVIGLNEQLAKTEQIEAANETSTAASLSLSISQGLKSQTATRHEAIVVSHNQQFWALAIDESENILDIEEANIDFLSNSQNQYIKAYASHEGQLINLLNIEAICQANL